MKNKPVIDMEKALHEKEVMQKHFVREHGYRSSVFDLLIEHFKNGLKKRKEGDKNNDGKR